MERPTLLAISALPLTAILNFVAGVDARLNLYSPNTADIAGKSQALELSNFKDCPSRSEILVRSFITIDSLPDYESGGLTVPKYGPKKLDEWHAEAESVEALGKRIEAYCPFPFLLSLLHQLPPYLFHL